MAYNAQAIRQAYDGIAEGEDKFEKGFSLRNKIPQQFIMRHLAPSDVVLDAVGTSPEYTNHASAARVTAWRIGQMSGKVIE